MNPVIYIRRNSGCMEGKYYGRIKSRRGGV